MFQIGYALSGTQAGTFTMTFSDTQNLVPPESSAPPSVSVCTYTSSEPVLGHSSPMSEGAVRLVNSALSAVIPERAILRDANEDF
jgi:hypothetical protein